MHKGIVVRTWLRRIRVAALLGLAWAAAWAPVGVLLGLIVDSDGSMDEMWVAVGGYPGFLCGVVFCAMLGFAKGRGRFEEYPLARAGAFGAVSGVLVGALPFVVLVSNETGDPRGQLLGALIIASITLSSAVSAAGSVVLAKWWRRKDSSTPVQE